MTELDFLGKFSYGKMGTKWAYNRVSLDLLKNKLYWICSVMKICIIYCVSTQISYLVIFFPWDIGQNFLSKSSSRSFWSTISISRINQWNSLIFLPVDKNLIVKMNQNIFAWAWSEMGSASLDSKVDWRTNGWNELIFCILVQIQRI